MKRAKLRWRPLCVSAALLVLLCACGREETPPGGGETGGVSSAPQASRAGASGAEEPAAPPPVESMERAPLVPDDPRAITFYLENTNHQIQQPVFVPYRVEHGGVIDARLLEDCFGRHSYLQGPALEEVFLWEDSAVVVGQYAADIAVTIEKNVSAVNRILFYESAGAEEPSTSVELDGSLQISLPDHSMEELAALRRQIPYRPSNRMPPETDGGTRGGFFLEGDTVAGAIESYLHMLTAGFGNVPGTDFADINDDAALPYTLNAAVLLTRRCTWGESTSDYTIHAPQLAPLTQTTPVWGDSGELREHVEQTARTLYGAAYDYRPEDYRGQAFYESYGGVFVPLQLDYYLVDTPVVLDWEDLGDRYSATVVFLTSVHMSEDEAYNGYIDPFWQIVPEDALADYITGEEVRRRMTFEKGEAGALYLRSHEFLSAPKYAVSGARQLVEHRIPHIDADLLGVALRPDGADLEPLLKSLYYEPEALVLDAGAASYLIAPMYCNSVVRIEELAPAADGDAAGRVVYESDPADYRYCLLLVADGGRYRVTVEFGGRTASFLPGDEAGWTAADVGDPAPLLLLYPD